MNLTVPSMLGAALLCAAAPVAHADDWAELSWNARWGFGDITYRRDLPGITSADGTTTYEDSIGFYNVVGWEFPAMRAHRFLGGGGDITTRSTVRDNCDQAFENCTTTQLVFEFDNAYPSLYPSWQLNLTYNGPLDASGHLPFSDQGMGELLGHLSNNWNDVTFTTLDGSLLPQSQPIAAPVPEPGLLSLLALGGLITTVAVRRRQSAR